MVDLNYYYSRKITNRKSFPWKRRLLKRIEVKKIWFLFLRIILFFALVMLTATSVYYGRDFIARSPYLILCDIRFEGCKNLNPEELMGLAHLKRGSNILALDLKEITQRIITNPWVKEVKIERNLPHRLVIKITERVPVALADQEKLFLVDRDGNLFKEVEPQDYLDMPIITGLSFSASNAQRVQEVLTLLDTADQMGAFSKKNISEVHMEDGGWITLYTLTDSIPIQMKLKNYKEKLSLLRSLKKELANRQIKPQAIEIISLDEAHVKIASSSKS